MTKIRDLRAKRVDKAKAARNLLEQNTGDKFTKDIEAQVDALYAEIDRVDAEIERLEKQAKIDGENAADETAIENREREDAGLDPATRDRRSAYSKAFRNFLVNGVAALTREDAQLLREGAVQNAQGTGTGAAGGYLVPTGFGDALIEALKAYGGMRRVANVIKTSMGNSIPWPTVDETAQTGELVPESVAASSQDITFGTVSIGAYKFSSKVFTVPIELLMDQGPGIDIEAFIRRAAATRIARAQNQFFTTGTGVSQPRGAVTAASSGKVGATGQPASVTYDDLLDLIHSVDPAYRNGGQVDSGNEQGKASSVGFMFHDLTLRNLKKLKDSQNRPLWLPSVAQGEPDRFLDYGYTINQDMATMAANAKSILFGDFDQYLIRDIMEVTLFRFDDSAFMTKGQIGFLAWARADGNLMSAGQPLKFYQNSAT